MYMQKKYLNNILSKYMILSFKYFVHITCLFYRQVCFISMGLVGILS